MTIWVPDLSADSRPTYLAVADAIGAAVGLGQLVHRLVDAPRREQERAQTQA